MTRRPAAALRRSSLRSPMSRASSRQRSRVDSRSMVRRPGSNVRRRYPQIDRVPALDRETLAREYLARNRPVVLSTESAAWRSRWTPPALSDRYGRCEVETEDAQEVYVGERAHRMRPLR